jgi:hypothetical protein
LVDRTNGLGLCDSLLGKQQRLGRALLCNLVDVEQRSGD